LSFRTTRDLRLRSRPIRWWRCRARLLRGRYRQATLRVQRRRV